MGLRWMNCRTVGEMLPEYLSGTLGKGPDQRLFTHLNTCTRCAEEAELLRSLRRLATPLESRVESALPGLRLGLLAAGNQLVGPSHWRPAVTWAAAAASLIALVGWFLLGENGQFPTPAGADTPFRVSLEEGSLVIEWPENGDRVHRVSRSTSPADFTGATVVVVRGPRWVDLDPQPPARVYYYRVD